jgi:hypothetical protein
LQFSLRTAIPETFGYTLVYLENVLKLIYPGTTLTNKKEVRDEIMRRMNSE